MRPNRWRIWENQRLVIPDSHTFFTGQMVMLAMKIENIKSVRAETLFDTKLRSHWYILQKFLEFPWNIIGWLIRIILSTRKKHFFEWVDHSGSPSKSMTINSLRKHILIINRRFKNAVRELSYLDLFLHSLNILQQKFNEKKYVEFSSN